MYNDRRGSASEAFVHFPAEEIWLILSFIITAQIQNDVSLFERKYSLRMPTLQFTLYDSFAEAAKAMSTSTSLFEQKLPSSASTVFS